MAELVTANPATREKDWVNISFLTLTPVIAIVGTLWHALATGVAWWMPTLLVVMYLLVGISICAGYHRYFSHKSYECSPAVQAFYAFFGAMAAQNSILWWSASHRVHHNHVDEDWDPYNIRRGFWWAHILWIFQKNPGDPPANAADLRRNAVVMWQNRWHKVILILGGFGLPTLVGAAFGDPLGGLLWGGFLRVVVIHHTTFFVNSLAHSLGEPLYDHRVSARDNWLVALLTLGEGYHSFHHRFPADYRNGIRWYHWDPAKWWIRGLQAVGLASELRTTPEPRIEEALLQAEADALADRIAHADGELGAQVRARIAEARHALEQALVLWRRQAEERAEGVSKRWRETRREARQRLRHARATWKDAARMVRQLPASQPDPA